MKSTKFSQLFLVIVTVIAAVAMVGCNSNIEPPDDVIAPTITLTVPAADALAVTLNTSIVATFSEAMDDYTIIADNFTVTNGGVAIPGAVTYDEASMTATFDPTENLPASLPMVATITTGVKDLAGNAMAEDYTWTFTTGTVVDITPPTVLSTIPAADATGVAVGVNITATFSEAMKTTSISTSSFTISGGVTGVVSYNTETNVATFNPTSDLAASTTYTATISVGVLDLADNPLAEAKVWSFTTAAAGPDETAPTVASTSPAQSAKNVATTSAITATFSEEMDSATMIGTNFTVWKGTAAVAGVVSFDQPSKTITFTPGADLIAAGAFGPVYTARITTAAKDLAGNPLVEDKVWTFTPGSDTRAAVNLLTAGDYAILAQDLISNIPTSAINGDLGLGPAASTFYSGFAETYRDATGAIVPVGSARYATSTQVSGTGVYPTVGSGSIYSISMLGDAGLTKTKVDVAVADRITAYNDAAGRASPDVLNPGAGTINALTFAPGLYKWGTDLTITGDITLSGTATDIWIFQVSGTVSLASTKQIILSGGALPQNVFWQTAGIATLGTNSVFKGIILSASDIVMQTESRLDGRALSFTQVTLDQVVVNQPAQ